MHNYLGTFSSISPGLAKLVEVSTVVLALVAGQGAALQHPAWVLLTLTLLGPSGAVPVSKKYNRITV